MPLSYPEWFSPLDRERIDEALSHAVAPQAPFDNDDHSSVVVIGLVQHDYPSEQAAIDAVVFVFEQIVDVFRRRRARWSMDPAQARRAVDDLLEELVLWAFAWHPAKAATSSIVFADHVRDVLSTCAWWPAFVTLWSPAGVPVVESSVADPPDDPDEPLMSLSAAAELLHTDPKTLKRHAQKGVVTLIKVGSRYKMSPAELRRLKTSNAYLKYRDKSDN